MTSFYLVYNSHLFRFVEVAYVVIQITSRASCIYKDGPYIVFKKNDVR